MPESPRDAAFECAFLADDALKHYIAIHNRIFNEQATISSMFRNLFGRGTDFEELLREARNADQLWSKVEEHVASCFGTFRNDFEQTEQEFFAELIPYVKAVRQTTMLLCKRQEALFRKLKGVTLSMSEYQQIERDYKTAVENYVRLGSSLQIRMEKLFAETS